MKKYLLPLLVLFLLGSVSGVYVGTAPGVKDLGELQRGESKLVKFYISTNVQDTFALRPGLTTPQASFYMQDSSKRYDFEPEEASQEDISSWVRFDKDSYIVDPATEEVISLNNGGVTNAQGEVSFVVQVPKDAEPGYHIGAVNLNPDISGTAEGTGVSAMGLTQFLFVFRVPGKAERDIDISHVSGFRSGQDRARVDFLLKNNGTVTVRLSRADTKIFNQFGNHTGTITTGGTYLGPGETKVYSSIWKNPELEEGEYRVRGEMNYITGSSFLDSTIDLEEYSSPIDIQPSDDGQQGPPWWIIVMILMILGVLMYSFDIKPVIILLLVGLLAISAYIWMTDLPVYLIGVIITLTALLLYRWM